MNNKKNSHWVLIIFLFFLIGCSKNNDSEKELVINRNSDGEIISEISCKNGDTTLKDGICRYYQNGKLDEESNWKNGVINGNCYTFYPNGKIKVSLYFVNGFAEGVKKCYYSNGKVRSISNIRKSEFIGDKFYYNDNGKLILYCCKNFEGKNGYVIKYDGLKVISESDGILCQFNLLNDFDYDSVLCDKELIGELCVANPPNTKQKVYSCIKTKYGFKDRVELTIQKNIAHYKKRFTEKEKGPQLIIFFAELLDKNGVILKRDTLNTDIIVR